jgi:L-lactate dehydrogenase (cytochrome)
VASRPSLFYQTRVLLGRLKALALGAKGVYIGRAFLYGLGALGEAGVTTALEIIQKELDLTMAFCGLTDVRKVDKNIMVPGTY